MGDNFQVPGLGIAAVTSVRERECGGASLSGKPDPCAGGTRAARQGEPPNDNYIHVLQTHHRN